MYEKYEGNRMKSVFLSFDADEVIPFQRYLKNKKLRKYFNRETEAALAAAGKLTEELKLNPETPFYFSLGAIEFEDFGLKEIVNGSIDSNGEFSNKLFIEEGLQNVSPLNQFKVLQNMPLSFVSIEFGLTGDNAVLYSSAAGLLLQAVSSVSDGPILLGASKAYHNGKAAAGFALIEKVEIINSSFLNYKGEAVNMFRDWSDGAAV